MEHQQEQAQINPMAAESFVVSNERMGALLSQATQQAAFWEMQARAIEQRLQEVQQSLQTVLNKLQEKGIDLEELLQDDAPEAPETNEDAPEAPETAFPVSAPPEDGEDASAAS